MPEEVLYFILQAWSFPRVLSDSSAKLTQLEGKTMQTHAAAGVCMHKVCALGRQAHHRHPAEGSA